MLIRVRGANSGIKEYLEKGQKVGRDYSRDQLDERVILVGDLEAADFIIADMNKIGEKYLHITMSFKEDYISEEILKAITQEFEDFSMSAFSEDEYNFYAEAHLPKIKSYTDHKTGEFVERKPHIHIVIPEQNLLSGQLLNPFGKVDQQTQFLEAFQEHINSKYGLSSPKDHRRTAFSDESTILSRHKGDYFEGAHHKLKESILSEVLEKNITRYDDFSMLLKQYGETKIRNEGKPSEYLNIKPENSLKGINLKEYVFSREFIEQSTADKKRELAAELFNRYESSDSPRPTTDEYLERLQEWHQIRARELKYIKSGNIKLYETFRAADKTERLQLLNERETLFYQRHRTEDIHHDSLTKQPDTRRSIADIEHNLRAASRNIESTGRTLGNPEQTLRNVSDRRNRQIVRAIEQGLGRDQRSDQSDPRLLERDGRRADTLTAQLLSEHEERTFKTRAEERSEFATIKQELNARHLLEYLSKSHGVMPEKYEIVSGKDGSDRIKVGTRALNVSDFLTKEMNMHFREAAPILRSAYAAQCGDDTLPSPRTLPNKNLWEQFRTEWSETQKQRKEAAWTHQRETEHKRKETLRTDYRTERDTLRQDSGKTYAERKAELSFLRMRKVAGDMELRDTIKEERETLKGSFKKPLKEAYQEFLMERVEHGDEAALAELRRQRERESKPQSDRTIQPHLDDERDVKDFPSSLLKKLAYTVDRQGNVTYFDQRHHALLTDIGYRVDVQSEERIAAETALRLALHKFGSRITINGTDEFKQMVIDITVTNGLKIEFDDPAMNQKVQEDSELIRRGREYIGQQDLIQKQHEMDKKQAPHSHKMKNQKEISNEKEKGLSQESDIDNNDDQEQKKDKSKRKTISF